MEVLGTSGGFLEAFSGPNAPLSAAVCRKLGEELRAHRMDSKKGITTSSPTIAQRQGMTRASAPSTPSQNQTEDAGGRTAAQLYGKRQQLIEDGWNSPLRHLEEALKLEDPFNAAESLKDMHQQALEWSTTKWYPQVMLKLGNL